MAATLAIAVSKDGVQHLAILKPDPEGRKEAIALFQTIFPAVDEFNQRIKELVGKRPN